MMPLNENLERKIKKNLYGKPQSVEIIYPAGLKDAALHEVKTLLADLWFPHKYTCEISLIENVIRVDNIHLFAVTELLLRCLCISDIRLVILETKVVGNFSFEKKCREIAWDCYLNQNISVKVKVDSVASRAFHETGLKEILSEVIKDSVASIETGENSNETTSLYADLLKNRLTVSLSLAGDLLYKRGYRGTLSASAPLREDAASACIQNALRFARSQHLNYTPETIFIPFSGTGTFLFEYLLSCMQIAPGLLQREYALQKMPFFREKNFAFLLKKAHENCPLENKSLPAIYCIDNAESAHAALLANIQIFQTILAQNHFPLPEAALSGHCLNENFFELDLQKFFVDGNAAHVFIPLNPPYGIRFGKHQDQVMLYKNIALKLNEIAAITNQHQKHLVGFILCPTEQTWSQFCKTLTNAKMETYHFNQGGIDIRVCQYLI